MEIIGKLVKNVATQPNEDKFRTIRTTNPKINTTIVEQEGGLPALLALGFVASEEDANVLEVPKGELTMKEVRLVEDTKDWLKKELRAMSRSSSKSSLKENDADPAKAALRAQLEVSTRLYCLQIRKKCTQQHDSALYTGGSQGASSAGTGNHRLQSTAPARHRCKCNDCWCCRCCWKRIEQPSMNAVFFLVRA